MSNTADLDTKLAKLEDNKIWKEACDLGEFMYKQLDKFPDEERFHTEAKLQSLASDVMYYSALAVGHTAPSGTEYTWGHARKYTVALKTMYRFAGRQKFIELDPEIMVRLDKLIRAMDEQIKLAYAQSAQRQEEEKKQWASQYDLLKVISKKLDKARAEATKDSENETSK